MEHYDRNAFNPMLILCDGDAGREGARERERERKKKLFLSGEQIPVRSPQVCLALFFVEEKKRFVKRPSERQNVCKVMQRHRQSSWRRGVSGGLIGSVETGFSDMFTYFV